MRAVPSESGESRSGVGEGKRAAGRPAQLRKTRLRGLAMEGLEERTLLSSSTLPTVVTNPALNTLVNPTTGNQVNPSVAVDPNDPNDMVAVWVRDDPTHSVNNVSQFAQGAYSNDGGTTWSPLPGTLGNFIPDPTTSNPTVNFANVTDASVSFDGHNNFYVVDEAHEPAFGAGQVTLERYSFPAGGAPTQTLTNAPVYKWVPPNNSGPTAVYKPVVAADGNQAFYNDPSSGKNQIDPGTAFTPISGGTFGAVYVTLQSQNATVTINSNNTTFNSQVKLLTSVDGGQNFATATLSTVSINNGSAEQATAPQIAVSQGTTSGTVPGGQATVVWDNTNPGNIGGANDIIQSAAVNWDATGGAVNVYSPSVTPGTTVTAPPVQTANNASIAPQVTTIPIVVTGAPANFSIAQLQASLSLSFPDLSQISVQLQSPFNQRSIFLLKNSATYAASNNGATITRNPVVPPQGASQGAANLNGVTFNDDAATSLQGTNGGVSGPFKAEGGSLASAFGGIQANGVWNLVISNYAPLPGGNTGTVNSFGLTISGQTLGAEKTVVNLSNGGGIRGNVNAGFFSDLGTFLVAPNRGVDPAPVIASDNTLGGYSQFQGRLYVAYTDRVNSGGNPSDNSNIYLLTSDDGGATWRNPFTKAVANSTSGALQVNDDNAQTDGFSESTRPQFQPSLAVDPATGMLAVSFFDARNDAARARVATYVGTSIDGGASFSPETYVNVPQQGFDAITGQVVTLGPVPDNQSATGGIADTTFNFGDHQALVAFHGQILPFWSSNLNGDGNGSGGVEDLANGQTTTSLSQITVAHATAPVGPRVINVTQGPVGLGADALNPSNPNAGPAVSAFVLTFDRPIDPNSFNINGVTVTYESPTGAQSTYNGGLSFAPYGGATVIDGFTFYTQFRVTLNSPQTAVGTYSIKVAPQSANDFRTRIQYYNSVGGVPTLVNGEPMDQQLNAATAGTPTNAFLSPDPKNENNTLPLIVPGPHITGYKVSGGTGFDDLAYNSATPITYIDVTFDRNMNPATLVGHPEVILRMMGPAGLINDKFTITQPNPADLTTYRISFLNPTTSQPDPQILNGTYTVTLAPTVTDSNGNALDTNLNAGLYRLRGNNPYGTATPVTYAAAINPSPGLPIPDPTATTPGTLLAPIVVPDNFVVQGVQSVKFSITYPYTPDLTAYLLAPGATIVNGVPTGPFATLFSNIGGAAAGNNAFQNTTLVSSTNPSYTPVSKAGVPFFGTYQAQTPFTPFQGVQAQGTWQLYIVDNGANSGDLTGWSLTLLNNVATASTGLGEPVADQGTVSFRIFNDAPTNPQSNYDWTSAGPSPIGDFVSNRTGRVAGLAVDPSDPSGNTVYAGGASGGVWKTTNFLTTATQGPTWIPLTDFGPSSDNNIGGLAVFGVNNNPNQSVIFAGTGEGNTKTGGKGFLRSTDGGASWVWLDSTDNTLPYAQRDHKFNGNYTFKVVVDPHLTTTGQVIAYAAMGGPNGGIWQTVDTGMHWNLLRAGQATDVSLDLLSGTGTQGGNLQRVYGAFAGDGVYSSPNEGTSWFQMLGTTGDPLILNNNVNPPVPVPVTGPPSTPNGASSRILLAEPDIIASPDLNNPSVEDRLYQGWLYALVVNNNALSGLYLTKDFGQNWTKVHIATATGQGQGAFNPSNNPNLPDYNPLSNQGDYDVSFAIDPTNPNVVYIGGSSNPSSSGGSFGAGFLRVDTTGLMDPHNAVPFSGSQPDAGKLQRSSTGSLSLQNANNFVSPLDPTTDLPYLNLIRDPANEFGSAAFLTRNFALFNNTGADAKWIPFGDALAGSTDQHSLVTTVDPLTGHARLIIGDDQGVFTGVDNGGTYDQGIGTASLAFGTRNGNLTLTQFYYGAAEPSAHYFDTTNASNPQNNAARTVTFSGGAQDTGAVSSSDVLGTGNVQWGGGGGDATGVAYDPTGSGTLYQFIVPADADPGGTSFFQVNSAAATAGLYTSAADLQAEWGYAPIDYGQNVAVGNFAVNPINRAQIVITSATGQVYLTESTGQNWFVIGTPGSLDSSYAPAMAFGAPDPAAPKGVGNNDNFIYAGTVKGDIFVTTTGGGTFGGGNAWANISNGLAGAGIIKQIVPDPKSGTHDAYAVASNGVYYIADSVKSASNPTPTWVNISGTGAGNLFNLLTPPSGATMGTLGDPAGAATGTKQVNFLSSLQVDWRYLIPNQVGNPAAGTHPALYAGADSGVYRSLDGGVTWTPFPNTNPQLDNSPTMGGYLPHVPVTSLQLSAGNINQQTGRATISTANGVNDPSLLMASTYGQGTFFIQLAPLVFPNAFNGFNSANNIALDPASSTGVNAAGLQYFKLNSNPANPTNAIILDGLSEQSAFGNTVNISAIDETPGSPTFGQAVPVDPTTTATNLLGNFSLKIPSFYSQPGTYTVGLQATDQSGAKGNIATYTFVVTGPVPAPANVVLDPGSDSGPSSSDDYTFDNNSAAHPAPVFDVSGILPADPSAPTVPTTVYLLRATVVNGVPGAFVQVGSTTTLTGGTVQITDNGSVIPDTPVNNPADTPPPQANQYIYSAYQVNSLGTKGPNFAPSLAVIIDTTPPAAPTIALDPASDTGPSNSDGYTKTNANPVFDLTGVEPNANVYLLRNGVQVGSVTHATPGPGGSLQISDTSGTIPDSPVGTPPDTIASGHPYVYTVYQVDLAGNQGAASGGANVIVDTQPPATPGVSLDPSTDSGVVGDGVTQNNNGQYPAPLFDLTNIEPNTTITLYRAPAGGGAAQPVNTITVGAAPLPNPVTIADTNAGNGQIPNGNYVYTVTQTDLAGNTSLAGSASITIAANAPAPPAPFQLDPLSDTGFFSNDRVTSFNNATAATSPFFDASNVQANATVDLYRVPEINNVPTGTPTLVGTFFAGPAGGTVTVHDTNAGAGVIPDGTYFYTATQVSQANVASPPTPGVTVTISANPPQPNPPAAPVLEAGSDTSHGHNITQNNNTKAFPAPVFDAGTGGGVVPAGATVELFRTQANAAGTPLPGATPLLVNTLTDTGGGVVPIADTNAGGGQIPDGYYSYTVELISLSGVPTLMSKGTFVTIHTSAPTLPSPLKLDPLSDTGISHTDGITQITIGAPPVFDAGVPIGSATGTPVLPGATVVLMRAPADNNGNPTGAYTPVGSVTTTAGGVVQITDKTAPSNGVFSYEIQEFDQANNPSPAGDAIRVVYDSTQPQAPALPVLDPSNPGNPSLNLTSSTSPLIDLTVTVPGFKTNSDVTLYRDGTPVAFTGYDVATGTIKLSDPGPVSTGLHKYQASVTDPAGNKSPLSAPLFVTINNNPPGTLILDKNSDSGNQGDDVTNVTSPTFDVLQTTPGVTLVLLRDGANVAQAPTGAGGTVMITDPGPLAGDQFDQYTYTTEQIVNGVYSPPGPALTITIDTSSPTIPASFQLDPASETGGPGSNVTNSSTPTFDVGGITPGAKVELFRAPWVGGDPGTPQPIAMQTAPAGNGLVTVMISDPGVADGMYAYSAQQISAAGNPSQFTPTATVTVTTAKPAAPGLALDPNSGGPGTTTNLSSPTLDVTGVVAGNTLNIYRDGNPLKTIKVTSSNPVQVQDFNLTNGKYTYTATQTDGAGNTSPVSQPALTITVNTSAASVPTQPTLFLAKSSDTGIQGDNVTSTRQPFFTGHTDADTFVTLFENGQPAGSTSSDQNGNFTVQVGAPMGDGINTFTAQAANATNVKSAVSASLVLRTVTVQGDFLGTGATQPALFLPSTSQMLNWYVLYDASINGRAFGASGTDIPLIGDFTGIGREGLATFNPSTGTWTFESPSNYVPVTHLGSPSNTYANFGNGNNYTPVPADYDGTGGTEPAVFQPSSGQWYIKVGTKPLPAVVAPQPGDIPVPGNYDNTGKAELAVYRPSTQTWYIQGPKGLETDPFGGANDIPVPGMYDATVNSQAWSVAVWRPGTSTFLVQPVGGGATQVYPFQAGDLPAPGDYDGIGRTEPAVYRPSANEFLVWGPNDTAPRVVTYNGQPVKMGSSPGTTNYFVPLTSPYPYHLPSAQASVGFVVASARDFGTSVASFSAAAAPASPSSSALTTKAAAPASPSVKTVSAASVVVPSARTRPAQAGPAATTDAVLSKLYGAKTGRSFGGLL